MRRALAPAAFAILVGTPVLAWPCEPPPCEPGHVLPGPNGVVPKNAPGVWWSPGSRQLEGDAAAAVKLFRGSGDEQRAVEFTLSDAGGGAYWITPAKGFAEDGYYEVEATNTCVIGPSTMKTHFKVGPEAPFPEKLGDLRIQSRHREVITVSTSSGACSAEEDAAFLNIGIDYSPEAEPWQNLLHFRSEVDGKPWRPSNHLAESPPPGESWVGRGRERVHLLCAEKPEGHPGVVTGKHDLTIYAQIPGRAEQLESSTDLNLECEKLKRGVIKKHRNKGGPKDEPKPEKTPKLKDEAKAEKTPAEAAPDPRAPSGCACRSTAPGSTPSPAWLLLAALLIRRRMRAQPHFEACAEPRSGPKSPC